MKEQQKTPSAKTQRNKFLIFPHHFPNNEENNKKHAHRNKFSKIHQSI